MAFHPNFQSNGLVYAYYTDEDNGDIVVSEFQTNSEVDADEETEREVIRIRHRFATNHNGGHITFGPDDGYMYISTGDGGSGDDPRENAQDKGSLLGKLIRIDPLESGGDPYTVPSDNPYVGKKGDDEIYAIGLRNPFRFNFDPDNGNIMIGDVGQNRFEEVDIETSDTLRKANFGWDRYEGFKKSEAGDTADRPSKNKPRQAGPRLQPLEWRLGDRWPSRSRRGPHQPLRALPLHRLLHRHVPQLRAAAHEGGRLR